MMAEQNGSREELVEELGRLRQRVAALESAEAEHKRAEEDLAKSRAVLHAAIDCLPFNLFAIGLDGRYMLQNAESRAHHDADTIGKRPEDVCRNPDDLVVWQENNRRAFAGERVEGEVCLSLTGEKRYYHNIIAPIHNGEELLGILGVNIDITARKRAEAELQKAHDELERRVEERTAELAQANRLLQHVIEERGRAETALRQSEEKYRTLVEMSPDAVLMTDLEGRVTYASTQAVKMHGSQSADELLGRDPFDFLSPDDHEALLANRQKNKRDGVLRNVEYTFVRKDGSHFAGEVSAAIFRGPAGSPAGFVCIIRDITDRKRAEEALRNSYEELRAIYEGMVDGMNILDLGTVKAVRVNPALCRMMGYSEVEALQLTQDQVHPPESLPKIIETVREHVEGRTSRATDVPHVRKDGSLFYADISTTRIMYNNRPCLMCFFHDTTASREIHEALKRERRSLRHMLRASDHERQLIAYDIHDGLAQELAGALMQFQMYAHTRTTKPKEAAKAYAAGMTMLQQSHVEARRLISGVRPPILDESGVVAAVAHLVHDPALEGGPKLYLRSHVNFRRLAPVMENVIYRIVQEGLTNARNHSRSERIVVSLAQREDRLRIEVRDWGIGFDPKTAQDNRFGLEGIRERARLLGGKCRIKSKAGQGTSVLVELPVVERRHDE